MSSISRSRPEGAKKLLDPERLGALVAEGEFWSLTQLLANPRPAGRELSNAWTALSSSPSLPLGASEVRVQGSLGDSVPGGQPGTEQCQGG